MITSYIIGLSGMIVLMLFWWVVQRQWKRSFSDQITDEDVLAGRSDCANCGCSTYCEKKEKNNR
ncbi:MAG: hypothetical protein OER04_16910 [Cyclobacteriaceae bacterium]|nr:hypothetical protein [Cyclobacteriaceae bacterium]